MPKFKNKMINWLLFFLLISVNKMSFSDVNKNNCFVINKIKIEDTSLLSSKKQNQLTSKYLHQCLAVNDIQSIVNTITNEYIKMVISLHGRLFLIKIALIINLQLKS
ncbi:POTRA domain-containing protein [Proteus cibi]